MSDNSAGYYQYEEVNLPVVRFFSDARSRGNHGNRTETVLDLGCGRGRLGFEIEQLGYKVTGVEANRVAIAAARGRISELIELDLLQFERVGLALSGRRFDWLLASDVLEHLANPLETLQFYRHLLKPCGGLIVSLPNVALWDIRLRLLFGRFHYQDSGVLDRTHLRFFTIRTAHELLNDAGFNIVSTTFDPGIVRVFLPAIKWMIKNKGNVDPGIILESGAYRAYSRYVLPIERAICRLAPGLFAFRIVMQARLRDCAGERQSHRSQN